MLILRVGPLAYRGTADTKILRDGGISSEYAETGRNALELIGLYDYDLILTDLHLPDMLGNQLMRHTRATGCLMPVVVLAAHSTVDVIVKALNDGADDFIVLPCDPGEISARIRAVVRRNQGHDTSSLRLGAAELSLGNHELRVNGQKLSISPREFSVLELLFMKQGALVGKTSFLNHLYTGIEEPSSKTIDVIICRLRKKLATAGLPDLIGTVWGCGFILCERINPIEDLIPLAA
jgi:two-component system cell cycle response regulator CtrA